MFTVLKKVDMKFIYKKNAIIKNNRKMRQDNRYQSIKVPDK